MSIVLNYSSLWKATKDLACAFAATDVPSPGENSRGHCVSRVASGYGVPTRGWAVSRQSTVESLIHELPIGTIFLPATSGSPRLAFRAFSRWPSFPACCWSTCSAASRSGPSPVQPVRSIPMDPFLVFPAACAGRGVNKTRVGLGARTCCAVGVAATDEGDPAEGRGRRRGSVPLILGGLPAAVTVVLPGTAA